MEDTDRGSLRWYLLLKSSPAEKEILLKAWAGDMEARREMLALARFSLDGGHEMSPALQQWLADALCALSYAVSGGPNGWTPIDEALQCFGHEPKRGRPSLLTNEDIRKQLDIVNTVLVIAERFGKSAAVSAVAHAVPMSESKVWALVKLHRRINGLGDVCMSIRMIQRVLDASRRDPHVYSTEMRDFLAVTAIT